MPSRRCSGLSTRNKPPNDQKAWPPRFCSPSWSTTMTRLPASALSVAATSPASPPPTTITSASPAIASSPGDFGIEARGVVGGQRQTAVLRQNGGPQHVFRKKWVPILRPEYAQVIRNVNVFQFGTFPRPCAARRQHLI